MYKSILYSAFYLILLSQTAFAAPYHISAYKLANKAHLKNKNITYKLLPQPIVEKGSKKVSNVEIAARRILKNMETKLDDPKWTTYVDKLALKEYADSKGIPTLKTLKIYDSADEIDFSGFPKDFILKSNKASGRNLLVKDDIILSKRGGLKSVEGENIIDLDTQRKVRRIMNGWGNPYVSPEPQYEYTVPKIFLEELITSKHIVDVKYYISNGKATQIKIIEDNITAHNDYFYDTNFEELDCPDIPYNQAKFKVADYRKHKKTFDRYVASITPDIDLDFYRIDFFLMDDKVMLSEITLTPAAGKHMVNISNRLCDETLLG